jgi:hypothetical protein
VAAIVRVLHHVKASHVGVDMMDITVCGAIAPYNALLGGKLVALLMASPDVVEAYRRRYASTPSIIASAIAGRAMRRTPNLVLLGTTSLYSVGSSQYNRLKVPAPALGGMPGSEIQYRHLGHTVGFGSFHFSRDTLSAAEVVLARSRHGRRVNSIFGEGVNPKMRKVRSALAEIGLTADKFIKHRSSRIIYGVALATNFQEVLLGRAQKAVPIIPNTPQASAKFAAFWRDRWLSRRIDNSLVLEAVARNSTAYPVRHSARVELPPSADEAGSLFADPASSILA